MSARDAAEDASVAVVEKRRPCKPCGGTGLFRARNEPPDDCLTCQGTGWRPPARGEPGDPS